jgi:hypothetical protein
VNAKSAAIKDRGGKSGGRAVLLSNLMLDVMDKELEKRGHRFVRYADDCNIYVRSQKAGERVWKASSSSSLPSVSSSGSTRPRVRWPDRVSASSWALALWVESNLGAGSRRRPFTASKQGFGN